VAAKGLLADLTTIATPPLPASTSRRGVPEQQDARADEEHPDEIPDVDPVPARQRHEDDIPSIGLNPIRIAPVRIPIAPNAWLNRSRPPREDRQHNGQHERARSDHQRQRRFSHYPSPARRTTRLYPVGGGDRK
jgi:hypothetical protein